ncbi:MULTISPECIES: PID-CTERM protein-sorting domain-containing protein [Mesonia]|uniref:PID-CTERM protein-sorting domain-containing protein n=1 Tax=Mesonia TaxID=232115 RepID=UPI0012EC923E|nr:hypothetical protein [Mesonia mobilis]|tara:strand:+ start:464 stop:670 length:207 start_codon:yes stop_codon:yes gene_type:complete
MMKIKYILLVLGLSLLTVDSYAFQSRDPDDPSGDPSPPPPGFPVDGFVSVFLAAGAVVGVRSLKSKKK